MSLRRLVITFLPDRIQVRALYKHADGPSPSTKARRREVAKLARTGLERALEAMEAGPVADLGTSGFETREDVLDLSAASPDAESRVKGEASWS